VVEDLFAPFDGAPRDLGFLAIGGPMIDAAIVPGPKQRNTRENNVTIKAGEAPQDWEDKPAKRRQKATDTAQAVAALFAAIGASTNPADFEPERGQT